MEDDCSTGQLKRAELTEASIPTISKRPRHDVLEESPLLLPSSDSSEKIDVPSASGANSDPSASSYSVIGYDYHVFLSFRGSDTRKGFVDHLYHRLKQVGPRFHPKPVFRDDKDLPFGEKIGENLISAIKRSKVSIPIISKNYATSEWCLRELIHIMKCKERGEQKVFPVLYGVKPSEVRDLKGDFGDAFKSHEKHLDEEVKQQGLVALKNAVDLRVFEANGPEAELINELVQIIMGEQQRTFRLPLPGNLVEQQHTFLPPLPGNLVGNDDRVAEVMKLTDADPSGTRIIGIYGIDGIGKTTLATEICNEVSKKFECHSFLMDVRETINRKGMEHIQRLLVSDITKSYASRVRDSMRGITMIQLSCEKKKVLILLDDVGHRDHIDKLIGGCNFKSGSRIIITCRDKAILKSVYEIYELKELNREDSFFLFSQYAFEPKQPPTERLIDYWDIVAAIGGFPLALKIIGSFLKGKDQSIWEETRKKLKKVPHMDIQQKLRISYDSLGYEEQQMFLDVACFFIGIDKRFAAYLWEDLQYCPDSGLERMIELSLMKIDDNNKLRMQDQLRDLGRAIARPANKKPWKCSRLWDEKAVIVQRSKFCTASVLLTTLQVEDPSVTQEENRNIEALHLDENGSNMFMNRGSFKRMPYLKFLHLSKVDFDGNFEDSLSELRWLEWQDCPNSFKASNVHLEKLVILDLSRGYISHEWKGWSSIKVERLKVLNLSYCMGLKRTPNLSALKSLEMLILANCLYLKEIDPSIGDVKCLTSLDLAGCPTLQELPDSISHLVNLLTLDLRFCDKFKGFPESIGSLVKLECLLLGNMALPSEDAYSEGWHYLDLYCFDHIPHSIGKLESLTELHLTCAKISELPESIGGLKLLKILKIAGCTKLSSLPNAISQFWKLEELDATTCDDLEGGVPINGLFSLKIVRLGKLGHFTNLFMIDEWTYPSLESFSYLSSRQHLDLTNCDLPANLRVLDVTSHNCTLPRLSHLRDLKELSFQFCEFLESIPVLPSGILKLWVFWCGKLKELPSLSNLRFLSDLRITGCSELMEIKGLEGLTSLRDLSICGCKKLPNLNGLEHLEFLRELDIRDLDASLMNDHQFQVQCLGRLKNLEVLYISSCQSFTRLDISQLTHLEALVVNNCEDVVEIKGLEGLKKLTRLIIRGCKSIRKLPDLSLFDNLRQLDIEGCSNLHDVQDLEKVETVSH